MANLSKISPDRNVQFQLPFDQPARRSISRKKKSGPARRTSHASNEIFEEIKPKRSKLCLPILTLVSECGPQPENCPTAREVWRALLANGSLPCGADVCSVRPRLTELFQAGCLENPVNESGEIYRKKLPGDASASTWRITSRGLVLLDCLRREGRN